MRLELGRSPVDGNVGSGTTSSCRPFLTTSPRSSSPPCRLPCMGADATQGRVLACEEVKAPMLSADELADWRNTLRAWKPVGEVSELAEIMAALDPEEREQVLQMAPGAVGLHGEVEELLRRSP